MRTFTLFSAIVFAAALAPHSSYAQRPAAERTAAARTAERSDRSLVFVLNTGLEDLQTMSAVFRHAKAAAEQRRLREVVVLVYGRGMQAFDGTIRARPPALVEQIRGASREGVRIVLCAHAMESMGLDRADIDPPATEVRVEIVPNVIVTLVDLVADDAAVVRY